MCHTGQVSIFPGNLGPSRRTQGRCPCLGPCRCAPNSTSGMGLGGWGGKGGREHPRTMGHRQHRSGRTSLNCYVRYADRRRPPPLHRFDILVYPAGTLQQGRMGEWSVHTTTAEGRAPDWERRGAHNFSVPAPALQNHQFDPKLSASGQAPALRSFGSISYLPVPRATLGCFPDLENQTRGVVFVLCFWVTLCLACVTCA